MKLEFLFASHHPPGGLVECHSHCVLEIVYYAEGEGELWLEGRHCSFEPGSFHISPKGSGHKQFNKTDMRAICIGASQSGLEDLAGIWRDADGALRPLCESLLSEIAGRSIGYEKVVEGLLLQVAGLARRAAQCPAKAPQPPKKRIVERALRIIRERGGEVSVESLSDTLYISKDYLRHLVTRATGQSPIQHIIATRLERAERILLESGASVAEAASRSGFSDAYYFSKLFKKRFKLPPAAYRARMTGKDK